MRTRTRQEYGLFADSIDQKLVRLDMAFPPSCIFAGELVGMICSIQCSIEHKALDYPIEELRVFPAPALPLILASKPFLLNDPAHIRL